MHVARKYIKVVYLLFYNHIVPSELIIIKKSLLLQLCFYSILGQKFWGVISHLCHHYH